MSGVADADAGLPAGEARDGMEHAPAADDDELDALLRETGTETVPETGTETVPEAGSAAERPGTSEAGPGSDPGAADATVGAAQADPDPADPDPAGTDPAGTDPADPDSAGTDPADAARADTARKDTAQKDTAQKDAARQDATPRSGGRSGAAGRPAASRGKARTAQARTGTRPSPSDSGAAAGPGQAGSASRTARKGGTPRATPPGPQSGPAKGAGASRRPQAGGAPHASAAGAPPRRGTTAPAGAPPRRGQADGPPRRRGTTPSRPAEAGTAAPPAAPPRPGQPGSVPARPATAPRRPETVPARPATAPRRPETAPARPTSGGTAVPAAQDRSAPESAEGKAKRRISRRALIQAGLIGGAGVAALPLISLLGRMSPSNEPLPTNLNFSLNGNWLFGGQYMAGSESSFYDDSGFAPVTLPHTVSPLSWRDWNAGAWQQVWIYRRHFTGGPLISSRPPGNRIMVEFDGVMVNATVVINDQPVATHQGGYLPFSAELTGHVTSGDNLLAVLVDANCVPVPPMSLGRDADSVDFFQPGGIYRDVRLRVLPQAFLSDLFALPADVLTSQRRVDVECTIDSALAGYTEGILLVELYDGAELVAALSTPVGVQEPGVFTMKLSLTGLGPITLWSTDNPKLYRVQATLAFPGVGTHVLSRRIGFRDASFRPDGFYLNGERLQLFGLNRHQLYPYAGMAMPARVQRMDAEILKKELNCNMVRCSHYPQSPHFLDACDELGLLVWEEAPGWHNVNGSPGWQDLVVRNVRDMVTRDRSRPSVIIWGTRLNETADQPGLWAATRRAAAQLDGSRPSSGAMAYYQVAGWNEDVFAYNDYDHNEDAVQALLRPPLAGLPYLVTEAIGVDEAKPHRFSWTDPPAVLANQAVLHGQAQSLARSEPGYSGLLAWAAFDYASPEGLDPESVKWAGVADGFRVPKPGAAIYQSQVDPAVRPVIVPVFFWELAGVFPIPPTPTMIASNCEQLEIFINGVHVTTGMPATGTSPYGGLAYPPFLIHLPARLPRGTPELMIQGFLNGQQVTELRMSSNPAGDTLAMTVDDATIVADGSDATRAVFRAVDEYGNLRRYPAGQVTLNLAGPAALLGDNPFAFGDYGGLGAVWIRSLPGQTGTITLTASLPQLGHAQVQVRSVPPTRGSRLA